MSLTLFLSMAAFALAASISPGPVNLVALSSGVQHGFRASMRHVTGATLGFVLLLLLVGLGLHAALKDWPALIVAIRWAGVAFLLFMAYRLAVDDGQLSSPEHHTAPSVTYGALMQWLNPKAWLAAVAGVGAYASGGEARLVWQFAFIYFVICYASIGCWAYAGAFLRRFLGEPRRVRWLNRVMAAALVASALYLMWE
jgi:threonine/homoserine/homoserine lactone efflux protein